MAPGRIYVFLSPLKVVDLSNPGILYGVGSSVGRKLGIEFGHEMLFTKLRKVPSARNTRGNRFHLAVRRYLAYPSREKTRHYLQFRGDLLNRRHESIVSILPAEDQYNGLTTLYQDSVTVASRIITLNAIFGAEQSLGEHFAIDISAGLGARFKYVRHRDRIDPSDIFFEEEGGDGDFFARNKPERRGGYFNIPVDIRLLYRF